MSLKERSSFVELTGGELKYIRRFQMSVHDYGQEIDFSILEFECNRKKCNHLELFNYGTNLCMIAFDTTSDLMDYLDRSTFNFVIYPGKPFNYISLDGEADSISLKTLSGKTTDIELLVW